MIDFYLNGTNHLIKVMNGIKKKRVPNIFTHKFVKEITESESTYDRDYKELFQKLGLIDSHSNPTEHYYQYTQDETNKILTKRIKEAYSELFDMSNNADKLGVNKVAERLKIINAAENIDDKTTKKIAETFLALCRYTENSSTPDENNDNEDKEKPDNIVYENNMFNLDDIKELSTESNVNLFVNLQLPETQDEEVYEKIFKAYKKIYKK